MRKMVGIAVGAVALAGSLATGAQAQGGYRDRDRPGYRPPPPEQWVQLGCAEVRRQSDLDVISVGRREGRFKSIRLEVRRNSVHIDNLRVIYANGEPDNLEVRSEIREGGQSRPLDLKGYERSIDRIELTSRKGYETPRGRGPAQVCVLGLQGEARPVTPSPPYVPPSAGRWDPLGCQKVGFIQDRDVITVGRQEGRFRALRLDVRDNDVFFNDVTVVYANGERDHLPVRLNVRRNTQSPPYDLKGDRRSIERIELSYQSKPSFRGQATVCVQGQH